MKEKPTVLVVEDEMINRKILKKILAEHYNVLEAQNGADAWAILTSRTLEIAAVLTDIVMPGLDGYDLISKIRQASMLELPIIVLTGESDTESEQKALDAGAWDFVSKPYSARVLLSRLRNAMARRQAEVYERIEKMVAYDPLTGLYNRAQMFEQTKQMIAVHPEKQFAFYRVDIDRFALFNSAFGEEEGDRLLCYLASLFCELIEYYDLVVYGRIGADVFAVCVPYEESESRLHAAVDYIEKRLKDYKKNYLLEISIGVYIIEEPDIGIEEIYLRASMGAQKCKSQYGKHIGYYDEVSRKHVANEMTITNEMETALEEKQFVVYLQPKVNLSTNRVCGAEALVRWKHPSKGLISPSLFIPVFERNGFIPRLDHYVWETTCQMLRKWISAGKNPLPISVNISRISMYNPYLVNELVELVKKYELDFSMLQLEITESAYMTNPTLMNETIHQLRIAGFTILMDDFGSGYSSLNTLKEIEVDILKIDMKFLPVGQEVEKGEIILASIIKMANWLGMYVVVEGVETREQRDFLEGTGCDCVQGYYYAGHMSQSEYEEKYVFADYSVDLAGTVDTEVKSEHSVTILVIDDVEMDRRIIQEFFQDQFHVHCCTTAEEGLLYLKRNQNRVHLILIDNIMPGMSGIDFLTYCQDNPSLKAIPQIMITADDSVESQVKAFQCGAYDYIAKPLVKEVVLARVKHAMKMNQQYHVFENARHYYRNAIELNQSTGLLNKSAFYEICDKCMARYPEDRFALLVIGLDDSEAMNVCCEYPPRSDVSKIVGDILLNVFRKSDLLGCSEDEIFMVLMSNLPDREIVGRKAAEVSAAIEAACSRATHRNAGVSIGIAFREAGDTIDTMISQASVALYDAKSAENRNDFTETSK